MRQIYVKRSSPKGVSPGQERFFVADLTVESLGCDRKLTREELGFQLGANSSFCDGVTRRLIALKRDQLIAAADLPEVWDVLLRQGRDGQGAPFELPERPKRSGTIFHWVLSVVGLIVLGMLFAAVMWRRAVKRRTG